MKSKAWLSIMIYSVLWTWGPLRKKNLFHIIVRAIGTYKNNRHSIGNILYLWVVFKSIMQFPFIYREFQETCMKATKWELSHWLSQIYYKLLSVYVRVYLTERKQKAHRYTMFDNSMNICEDLLKLKFQHSWCEWLSLPGRSQEATMSLQWLVLTCHKELTT